VSMVLVLVGMGAGSDCQSNQMDLTRLALVSGL
jgi:hypothetical protein